MRKTPLQGESNMRHWIFTLFLSSVFWGLSSPSTCYGSAAKDFEELYIEKLEILTSSVDVEELESALDIISLAPTSTAHRVVSERIASLPDDTRALTSAQSIRVLSILLEVLNTVGSRNDLSLLYDTNSWIREVTSSDERDDVIDLISESVKHLEKITQNTDLAPFPGIEDFGSPEQRQLSQRRGHSQALEQVKNLYEVMKRKVVGQENILKALQRLFLKDILNNGRRTAPEVFYLMGLPGNGKDTIAEAYVDAIWGEDGAFENHMFRMDIKNKSEAWSYLGSGKGYIGSDGAIPLFLKFLVEHSGGKYVLAPEGSTMVVERNPLWTPYSATKESSPHKAVIFVNEAHNIPRSVKDSFFKQSIEKGIFKITNPGSTPDSVAEIILPVTFIFASNEGIELLEPREKNGARQGEPLSYKRLLENYERVYLDPQALKQAILNVNGELNNPLVGDGAPGTSEEFASRIPNGHIHILKPLSPEDLFEITKIVSASLSRQLSESPSQLGSYEIFLSEELIKFIVDFHYVASENARPVKDRLESFIYDQIYSSILNKEIKPLGTKQELHLELVEHEDGTRSVQFNVKDPLQENEYGFTSLIQETLIDRIKKPLSRERVLEITSMRQQILDNVFGVEPIVDRLIESAIVSESEARNAGESTRSATVMAFLGKTSTGKTATAQQYVAARYGTDERPVTIDFNGINTIKDINAKILGTIDHRANSIPSDFMKAYDRAPDGNIAFIFDEAANSPKELLQALYEILRASTATGFSDGKARDMKNVTIILTGNAGEEIYKAVPPDLPRDVQERALYEVFKVFLRNEDLQRRILMNTFPDALLARLGQNIYHFGPLQHKEKRQLSQLKLLQQLDGLRAKASESGWNLLFSEENDLLLLFDMIEQDGFNLENQGASIDKFVRESLVDKIKAALLVDGVSSGQNVVLSVVEEPLIRIKNELTFVSRQIVLTVESGKEITLEIPMGQKQDSPQLSETDRILVAYHEVGHEIVSEVYFGDRIRPKFLSIIEGVALIGSEMVHYEGLRSGEELERSQFTKELVLRRVAVLSGGYVAQQIVTLGARHDAGKSNDMHRATTLIQKAILTFGLSDEWGTRAVTNGLSIDDYIGNELSDLEKEKLNRITNAWLQEGEQLAREAILINGQGLFLEMSKRLASKGYVDTEAILKLYEANGVVTEWSGGSFAQRLEEVQFVIDAVDAGFKKSNEQFLQNFTRENFEENTAEAAYNFLVKKSSGVLLSFFRPKPWSQLTSLQRFTAQSYIAGKIKDAGRDARLSSADWLPASVANIGDIIEAERAEAVAPVTRTSDFDYYSTPGEALTCKSFL